MSSKKRKRTSPKPIIESVSPQVEETPVVEEAPVVEEKKEEAGKRLSLSKKRNRTSPKPIIESVLPQVEETPVVEEKKKKEESGKRLSLSKKKSLKPKKSQELPVVTEDALEESKVSFGVEYEPPADNVKVEEEVIEETETVEKSSGRKKLSLGGKKKSMRPGSPVAQALETDKKILDLHKEEVLEPKVTNEIIKEEVIETPQDRMMDVLDQQLSSMAKLGNIDKPEPKSLVEQKMELMEKQMTDMRRLILETSQSTIVNGLGAGSPGSGEVEFLKLDDVDGPTFDKNAEGQIIMWDKDSQKFTSIPLVTTTQDDNDVSKELQGFYGMRSSYYYGGTAQTTIIDVSEVDTWIDVNFTTDSEGLYDNRTSAMKSASAVGHTGVGTQVDPIAFLLDGLTSRSTLNLNASLSFLPESDEGQLEVRLNFTRNSSSALGNFFIPDIVANMDQGASLEYEIEQSLSFFCDDTISTVAPGDAGQFTFQVRSTTAGTLSLRALTLYISQ